jgi:hypothetical protein
MHNGVVIVGIQTLPVTAKTIKNSDATEITL